MRVNFVNVKRVLYKKLRTTTTNEKLQIYYSGFNKALLTLIYDYCIGIYNYTFIFRIVHKQYANKQSKN